MVNRRIRMGKIKEIIRLYEAGLSIRKIAQALAVSRPVVSQYIINYRSSGLKYKNIANISDTRLLELLGKKKKESQKYKELAVNFDYYTKELKKKGVTLHILWEEYMQKYPDGYKYTQFCYHYQIWRQAGNVTMHLKHKAFISCFVFKVHGSFIYFTSNLKVVAELGIAISIRMFLVVFLPQKVKSNSCFFKLYSKIFKAGFKNSIFG